MLNRLRLAGCSGSRSRSAQSPEPRAIPSCAASSKSDPGIRVVVTRRAGVCLGGGAEGALIPEHQCRRMARNPMIAAQRPALRAMPTREPLAACSRSAGARMAWCDVALPLTRSNPWRPEVRAVRIGAGKGALCIAVILKEPIAKLPYLLSLALFWQPWVLSSCVSDRKLIGFVPTLLVRVNARRGRKTQN